MKTTLIPRRSRVAAICALLLTALSSSASAAEDRSASICVKVASDGSFPSVLVGEELTIRPKMSEATCAAVVPGRYSIRLEPPESNSLTYLVAAKEVAHFVVCKSSLLAGSPSWRIVLASRVRECDKP